MPELLKVEKVVRTCTACPAQWAGVLSDGRKFYARYRWGRFGFGVGNTADQAVDNCKYPEPPADPFDGFMKDSVFQKLMEQYGFDFTHAKWTGDKIETEI